MGMVGTIIVLLVAATAVAMVVQRLKLPYTVALVLAGLGLGAMHGAVPGLGLEQLRLTPDLLFGVFLPVLLFEAAFHVSWRKFKKNLRAILLLAVPGVAVAIGLAVCDRGFAHLLRPEVRRRRDNGVAKVAG